MFDGRWREAVDRRTGPVGTALHRHGVTADVLTATGLLSAVATAWMVAIGHLIIAIFLLTLTGLHDLFDGPVAKAAGTSSVRGAFFDSVVDRMSDAVLMGGVSWYLISQHRGHLVLLPLAILGVTSLISYQRAKADALGMGGATGGLMERAERMILLGVGFLSPVMLVPDLWVLLGLTSATAMGRFVRVWRAAEGPPRVVADRGGRSRWREARVESRWRVWREARASGERASRSASSDSRWRTRRREAPLASRSGRLRRAGNRRVRVGRSSSGDSLS
jgi:CDP-diacylglycerol---glycerol-3-phosphate 3-phosphatidyltransferase